MVSVYCENGKKNLETQEPQKKKKELVLKKEWHPPALRWIPR